MVVVVGRFCGLEVGVLDPARVGTYNLYTWWLVVAATPHVMIVGRGQGSGSRLFNEEAPLHYISV